MKPRTPRREQLGAFLASRRRAAPRGALGLPPTSRRNDVGLSREEIATLAGVSGTWYTWLEQGRAINVSRHVLGAVARVLALSAAETEFVYALADREDTPAETTRDGFGDDLQGLLDALDFPAFVVTTDWTIAGWNAAYAWLYPAITTVPAPERNLLRLIYTDPALREMLPDWDQDSRAFLAEFRAESGVRLGAPAHKQLIDALNATSEDFRVQWAEMAVARFAARTRTFVHHEAGPVTFTQHRLVPSQAPDLHVVMYVPSGP